MVVNREFNKEICNYPVDIQGEIAKNTMLDSLKLKLVWLIVEQEKANISPKASDSEILQPIMDKLQSQIILSTLEQFDIYLYVQSQMPLIRDLAEIQAAEFQVVEILKK